MEFQGLIGGAEEVPAESLENFRPIDPIWFDFKRFQSFEFKSFSWKAAMETHQALYLAGEPTGRPSSSPFS